MKNKSIIDVLTLQGTFSIASEQDWPDVQNLLNETKNWLKAAGTPLWEHLDFEQAYVIKAIRENDAVLYRDGEILAALMFLQDSDPEIWPEHSGRNDCLYLHRLCVSRSYAGTGLSRRMIDYAKTYGQLQHKRGLYLDCAPREALTGLYRGAGFQHLDTVFAGGYEVCRFGMAL